MARSRPTSSAARLGNTTTHIDLPRFDRRARSHLGRGNRAGIPGFLAYYSRIVNKRPELPYDIDDVTCKANTLDCQARVRFVSRAPRSAIALHILRRAVLTMVQDVEFQVGRTGALPPGARFEPRRVCGVAPRNATLHNMDEPKRKDVRIGYTVIARRAGDAIPEITKVILELRPADAGDVTRYQDAYGSQGAFAMRATTNE